MKPAPESFEAARSQYHDLLWSRIHYWRQRNPAICADDLMQEGLIAVRDALTTFDPQGGSGFTAWLIWGLDNNMRRHCIRMGNTVRVPEARFGKLLIKCHSLNRPLYEDGVAEIIDVLPAPEADECADTDELDILDKALKQLPWRHAYVLDALFVQGLKQREAADRLGISKQAVYMIKERALESLRQHPLIRRMAA